MTPYNWIRRVSGMSHQELVESLEDDKIEYILPLKKEKDPTIEVGKLPKDCINLFDEFQVNYYSSNSIVLKALEFIKKRRLDTAINRPRALFLSIVDDFHKNRLVIPFYDEQDNVLFYQTRKIIENEEEPNYKSKFSSDKSIFGIDKVDPELDSVFLFEGPFDSFFVKNGLAVAGINKSKNFTLTETQKSQMTGLFHMRKIWVLDSQWLDETSKEKTLHLLENGECVFIWPKKWGKRYKDLNDLCIDLNLDQISPKFIENNTLCGVSGILKYKLMIGFK